MPERFPCGRIPVEKTALAATGQTRIRGGLGMRLMKKTQEQNDPQVSFHDNKLF